MEKKTFLPQSLVRPLLVVLVVVAIIVLGVFWVFRSEESSRDGAPRVAIEKGEYPEGWKTYEHESYAIAYPPDIAVVYEDPFDILTFYYSEEATESVAQLFPSRSIADEVDQLNKLHPGGVSTADVYGDAIKLTLISFVVPNSAGGEDVIKYYMFTDRLHGKTYTFKMNSGVSWEDFDAVAQTIRTP